MASSQALSPIASDPTLLASTHHPTDNSFPIIAIAVIGILATGFLLVSYYVFVIKCCLNWHRVDLLRRFSASQRGDSPLIPEYEVSTARGLDESVIRAIPILKYKNRGFGDKSFCECAVCLNEFQEEEKLRYIPNCSHVFHIDCIDVWLQNNENCPLCRTSISATPTHTQTHLEHPATQTHRLSPLFGNPTLYDDSFTGNDEDYVIIDLPGRHSESMNRSLLSGESERSNLAPSITVTTPLTPLRPEQRAGFKKSRTRLSQISSKGDECIDIRTKDEKFDIQPIRRSFSLGSSDDHKLCLMVQEIVKQQIHTHNNTVANEEAVISPVSGEGCSNNKLRRSFFSFGSGRGSKSSILPVQSET